MSVEIIGASENYVIKEELTNLLQDAIMTSKIEDKVKRCSEFVEIVCNLIAISSNRKSKNENLSSFDGEDTLNRLGIRTRKVNGELLLMENIIDNICAKWKTLGKVERNQITKIFENLYKSGIDRLCKM